MVRRNTQGMHFRYCEFRDTSPFIIHAEELGDEYKISNMQAVMQV